MAFKPNFKYITKIVNNLTEIASAREVILNAYLVPKWEVSLRREALIKNAHHSTSIEGNPLSLEEVSDLAAGRKVMTTRKARKEVLNYLYVLEHISDFAKGGVIREKDLLRMYKALTKGTLDRPEDSGRYRDRQVVVGNRVTGEVVFMPPETEKVPVLVREFLQWLNSEESRDLNPVLVAGIAHYELVRIHPFVDGNGRTARALATLILFLRGFDTKRFFALDDYYDSDRASYYRTLKSVDPETVDITGWLGYFTDGVLVSLAGVKERILRLSSEKLKKDTKGQIALTERQMKIIEHINTKGKITIGEMNEMFGISRQASLKEISKLVEMGVVKLVGKGRGAHYVIV